LALQRGLSERPVESRHLRSLLGAVKGIPENADLRHEHPRRYRVRLLENPELLESGIAHGDPTNPSIVEWASIDWALAAEIGEPEGVRTIIVDLVVGRNRGPDGGAYEICRLGAEPGEEAMELATAIERALAPQSSAPSIKSLAAEGTPSRWYQNIEEFESAALESLDP